MAPFVGARGSTQIKMSAIRAADPVDRREARVHAIAARRVRSARRYVASTFPRVCRDEPVSESPILRQRRRIEPPAPMTQ